MSQRNVSVLVLPDRWDGTPDELAQRLVSMTHQSADRLSTALARGPVTIDADLRPEEAERLCGQLERLGVPAEARDEEGTVVAETGAGDGGSGEKEAVEADDDGEGGFDGFDEMDDSVEAMFESADLEDDSEAAFDELESVDGDLDEGAPARADESEADSDGWNEVLGGDSKDGGSTADDAPGDEDEPSGDSEGGLTLLDDEEQQEAPSLEELGGDDPEPASGESPAPDGDDKPPQPPSPGPPGADDNMDSVSSPETLSSAASEPESGPAAADEPAVPQPESPGMPPSPGPPSEKDDGGGFDSKGMTEVLTETGGSGEYETGSFDNRPEHVPALAALLSLLAPGAGQIYNGEHDKAWDYAIRAPLILPWYDSVQDALERARAIRNREAPKPSPGTFVASLKHLGVLLVAGVTFIVGAYYGMQLLADQFRPEEPKGPDITETDRRRAVQNAKLKVHGARIESWEFAGRQSNGEEDTEVDEMERAEELFLIGYQHCDDRELEKCADKMGEVTRLDSPFRRRAYRLQTWAKMQMNPKFDHKKMPEVSIDREGAKPEEPEKRELSIEAGSGDTGGNLADEADAATLSDDRDAGPGDGSGESGD